MSPGYGIVPAGQGGHTRTSSAERERAVDVLKAGFAEGRLDQDEYAERVEFAYRARTHAELASVIADLPVGPFVAESQIFIAQQAPVETYRPGPGRKGTNNMALAALLLGLGAFPTMGITAVPAIGLSLAAFWSITRTGDRGAFMAGIGAFAGIVAMPLLFILLGHQL